MGLLAACLDCIMLCSLFIIEDGGLQFWHFYAPPYMYFFRPKIRDAFNFTSYLTVGLLQTIYMNITYFVMTYFIIRD